MPTNSASEAAIRNDDMPTFTRLLASPSSPPPLDLLILAAKFSRPIPFSHLLTTYPALNSSLNSDPLLLAALTGGSIPIWRLILEHEPSAKDHRFGHFGIVVDRCVFNGDKDLLEFLLAEGARVEETGRRILVRAEVCGASQEIKDLLLRYGARKDFNEDGEVEAE